MSARLVALRSEIGFATPELPDGWSRAKAARSELLGCSFEAVFATQAVSLGSRNMSAVSSTVDDAISTMRVAIISHHSEKRLADLEALMHQAMEGGTFYR
jgi:hypothetical protein